MSRSPALLVLAGIAATAQTWLGSANGARDAPSRTVSLIAAQAVQRSRERRCGRRHDVVTSPADLIVLAIARRTLLSRPTQVSSQPAQRHAGQVNLPGIISGSPPPDLPDAYKRDSPTGYYGSERYLDTRYVPDAFGTQVISDEDLRRTHDVSN